jgi:hypothetical protein
VKATVEVIGDHGCEYMIVVTKKTRNLGIEVIRKRNKQFGNYSKHKKKHGYLFSLRYVHKAKKNHYAFGLVGSELMLSSYM